MLFVVVFTGKCQVFRKFLLTLAPFAAFERPGALAILDTRSRKDETEHAFEKHSQ